MNWLHTRNKAKAEALTSHAALSFFTLAITTVVALPSRDVVTLRLCRASSVGMDTLRYELDHECQPPPEPALHGSAHCSTGSATPQVIIITEESVCHLHPRTGTSHQQQHTP